MRKKSGLTQAEAAKKLKMNVGFWCRVESGAVDLPLKHYKKVSKLFRVPLTNLVKFRVSRFEKSLKNSLGMRAK